MPIHREFHRMSHNNHFVRRRLLLRNGFWISSEMPVHLGIAKASVMTYSTRFMRLFSCESSTGAVRPCIARARPRMNDMRTIVDVVVKILKLKVENGDCNVAKP